MERFDSRGQDGEPSWWVYIELAPEEMGKQAGGAPGPFVMPPPRSYAYVAQSLNEAETPSSRSDKSNLSATLGSTMHPELAAMLGHSIVLERASGEEGLDLFEEAVKADLQKIYATPTGRALLQSLHASGKQTTISYAFDGLNRAIIPKAHAEQCYYKADGITPEKGLGLTIAYNPAREVIGEEAWAKRPPAIGLAHELIHAEQAAYGRMREGMGTNPGRINRLDPTKPAQAPVLELETVGVPPHDDYHVTENKIRQEWTPTQPLRTQY